MIRNIKLILLTLFLVIPLLNHAQNLYFVQEKNLVQDVISMKVRNHNQYIGVLFLQKSGKYYVLKLQTYLENRAMTEFEVDRFSSKENLNFDFAMDANSLYAIYQNGDNKITYQRIDSIYSKPAVIRKEIISEDPSKVYSVPSIYKIGKKIYVFYHKESEKNKLDIQLKISENGSDFSPAFNFTDNLGYAIYPNLVVLRDRLGIFFQAREQESQGRIYFELFYYQLNLEGNSVLSKTRLTKDMGDNFSVQGFFLDNRYFLTWENRLNNWRIFYSAMDPLSGKLLISPQMLTSTYYNYRKPSITRMGDKTYLLVQKMESESDQLYAYQIFSDGRISGETGTGIALTDHVMISTENLWLFVLKKDGALTRREIDRNTYPISLVPYFSGREVFSLRNLKMQWEPIQDESGVEALYYAFDRNPNTIPDEFSKINPGTNFVNLYAPEDGTWYFHVYYQDKAGNKSQVLHKKIVIDTSIPQTPDADFSANAVLDPTKNLLDNTENILIQWKSQENTDYYLYAVSLYPKFYPHTAKKMKENQISIPSLKPGKYFFHLQSVNGAGTKGEVLSTPFYVKKYNDTPDIFFDPGTSSSQKIFIKKILVKNINLIPIRPYLGSGKTPYHIIPFWELPVTLKLKVAVTAALIFLLVFLLYLILFARHKKLIYAYETLKKSPLKSEGMHSLEEILEGEINVLPGIGDLMIANMSEERRIKYQELIQRADHLDQDIHKLEKELGNKIIHGSSGISAVKEAELIEQTLEEAQEFIHEAEEVLSDEIMEPGFEPIQEKGILEAEIILESPVKIENGEDSEEILEADELSEIHDVQEADEIEEPEEIEEIQDAYEVEEAHEIQDAEEPQEIHEEAEEVEEITDHGHMEETRERSTEKQPPLKNAAESREKEPTLSQNPQEEKKPPQKEPKEKKEFRERIKLKLKYSFLITILVMFTVGAGSLINGYFSLKQIKETLSIENLKRAEIAVKTLAINTRDPIRINDDALIVDAIANVKSIEDVLYSQVMKRDIDINTGQNRWFFRDDQGNFKMLDDESVIKKMTELVTQNQKPKVLIEPEFTLSQVLKEYTLYYPILYIKDQNFQLSEKDYGNRFLGLARINFSTSRIFEILDEQRNQIFRLTLLIAAAMLGVGLLGAILLAYFTVKPISRLVQGVQIVGQGNLNHQIEITTHDEIGRLTYEFNKMTAQLLVAQEESIKKKVLEEQFSIAEGIQKSLIPQENLILKDVEITGFYQAALGVGGDYYDFFEIDKDRVGVVLCDVAGKGIPAALMMVNIRTVFKTNIKKPNITPKEIINILNNVLAEDLANDMFATLFFFIFNRKTREAVYCNAGHGPFTYYSQSQRKVIQPPTARTMPLGVMPDNPQYVDEKFVLAPNDLVIVYTDGISEAMDINHEEYSEPRLFETLANLGKSGISTEEVTHGIIDDVKDFVGEAPQSDDISMILMKVK